MNSGDRWRSMMLGDWEPAADAVHKREDIERMLTRGEISNDRAQEMLRERYLLAHRPRREDL